MTSYPFLRCKVVLLCYTIMYNVEEGIHEENEDSGGG